MLRRLLGTYLKPFRGLLIAVVVLQFGQTMAMLFLPTLNARLIDEGIVNGDTGLIWRLGGVMLAVSAAQVLLSVAAVSVGARAAMGFGRDVRNALFETVTEFSNREVTGFGAPSLITRVTNDVQQVQILVVTSATMLAAAPITAIGGTVLALRQDVGLSLVLGFAIPALVLGVALLLSQLLPQFRQMQVRIDAVNGVLREQLMGLRVVKAFVRERFEVERFGRANADLTETALRAGKLMAFMFPLVIVVLNLSSAGAIWVGADRIAAGELQPGELIAFLSYLIQILMAVMMATFMAVLAPRAAVSAERIGEVLATSTSVVVSKNPTCTPPLTGTIECRGVGFCYPGAEAPVLDGVSFIARPGETTAIVGSTGAGKTTLVNVLQRLIDPTSGSVCFDGIDARELAPEALWSSLGVVSQKPFLFSGTVATNLRFGVPDANDDDLWHALEVAQAADFVREMDGQLAASVNQGGTNLSGGQRQRLAIARAIARKPTTFLFDDSFSALDVATEARLRAALADETADASVIVVAQRVTSIMGADQIVVLEDGKVMGIGTHDQLAAGCDTYGEIIESQRVGERA